MQTIDLLTPHPLLPDTTRTATVEYTDNNYRQKFSRLTVLIDNYQNGVLIQNETIGSHYVILRADNSVLVDAQGNPIAEPEGGYTQEQIDTYMGEFDYIDYLETIDLPFSVKQFKQNVVLRAEQQGRFDK